jgi:pyrroloquinoline quinone biosynthesis protein D
VRLRTQASSSTTRYWEPVAAEIIKRCTGPATLGELVDDLATTYAAPREKIVADAGSLLRGFADKKTPGLW